jgi:hypothetical protein
VERGGSLETLIGMMVAGTVVTALLLAQQPSWTLTMIDVGFWVAVAGIVGGRYVLVTKFREPTPEQMSWWRVGLGLLAACTVWLAAQAVGGEPVE